MVSDNPNTCSVMDWNTSVDKANSLGKVRIGYLADRDLNVPEDIELVLTTEQVTLMRQSLEKLEANLKVSAEQAPAGTEATRKP
jgi:hypothetical protein